MVGLGPYFRILRSLLDDSHITYLSKILTREIHLMPTKYLQGRKNMYADACKGKVYDPWQ